jgi:tRNA threonylcarbamoyladenosine biosynthesis protein TsaE
LVIKTRSGQETIQLGKRIGRSLKPNDIIALTGDLGAGKTTLIQGIAKGMGIKNWVTSPTFTIINEFKGRLDLFHVDLYRIEGLEEIEDIALEEYFNKDGVTVIEWAEKAGDILPASRINIKIDFESENERNIIIKGMEL